MELLAKATMVIILQYVSYQINTLYTLNLFDVICQLCPNYNKMK